MKVLFTLGCMGTFLFLMLTLFFGYSACFAPGSVDTDYTSAAGLSAGFLALFLVGTIVSGIALSCRHTCCNCR